MLNSAVCIICSMLVSCGNRGLKDAYSSYFPIGNIIDSLYIDDPYFSLLKRHFSVVTPGNNLKPDYLAPNTKGGEYKWKEADKMTDKALANGFKVIGHVLVWHRQTPAWMTQGTGEEVKNNLEKYITDVMTHFKGRIFVWDVVNEAFRDDLSGVKDTTDWKTCLRTDKNNYGASSWYGALGADYIEIAFRAARAADSDVILYYNDYSMDNQNKARAAANMIIDINARYKEETGGSRNLIEGIGLQSHYQAAGWFNVYYVRLSLDLFISLGIKTAVSELDIRMTDYKEAAGRDSVMTPDDAQAQAKLYAELFSLYKSRAENISRVTMWGMDDRNSWLSSGNPCLFDRNLKPKAAFHAIINPDKLPDAPAE